jgi:hypothetical protein
MLQTLKELSLDHLELFLGGNYCVNDEFLNQISSYVKETSLRGLELDIGYTECTSVGVERNFSFKKPGLIRLGLYLNG